MISCYFHYILKSFLKNFKILYFKYFNYYYLYKARSKLWAPYVLQIINRYNNFSDGGGGGNCRMLPICIVVPSIWDCPIYNFNDQD